MTRAQHTVLFIGRTWPNPKMTAAGWRMKQLIDYFQSENYTVFFAAAEQYCTKKNKEAITEFQHLFPDVDALLIALNDDGFDHEINRIKPDFVIFDRFMTEEQYGWRVRECCPEAMTILDTEDCHFLRLARANYIKKHPQAFDASSCQDEELYTEITMRELASIYRCDLSLIISKFEYQLLRQVFSLPEGLLSYLPLATEEISSDDNTPESKQEKTWSLRSNFLWVGNRKHQPNDDSLKYLLEVLWPLIHGQCPGAELHIVGPNGTEQQRQLILKSKSVIDLGWVDALDELMGRYRVNLAPLRFGAGLKGKIMQPMALNLPTVCSSIGAEGLMLENIPELAPALKAEEFVAKAICLYSDQELWVQVQKQGAYEINQNFSKARVFLSFNDELWAIKNDLKAHRHRYFMGQILQHQSLNASKHMGRWLTLKNRSINPE